MLQKFVFAEKMSNSRYKCQIYHVSSQIHIKFDKVQPKFDVGFKRRHVLTDLRGSTKSPYRLLLDNINLTFS